MRIGIKEKDRKREKNKKEFTRRQAQRHQLEYVRPINYLVNRAKADSMKIHYVFQFIKYIMRIEFM